MTELIIKITDETLSVCFIVLSIIALVGGYFDCDFFYICIFMMLFFSVSSYLLYRGDKNEI